jgi:two-component system, NtrC family, response regulator GlrR
MNQRRIRGGTHPTELLVSTEENEGDFPIQPLDSMSPTLVMSGSDFGFTTTIARNQPQLRWSDTSGSHSFAMGRHLVMGSAENADAVIQDESVSRLHANLELRDDGVWIRDLGSRNGTYIDGIKVIEARVPDNATISLGSARVTLHYDQLITDVPVWPTESFGPMVGRSLAMRELFAQLHRVAQSDSTVLILGETGTGKELVARAVHASSPRASRPFIVVDCGALSESLLEAELFGHSRGAFTGASSARVGVIEAAEGGTVFLDEIGEMPLSMQPRLLRALEGHTVRRVGENEHRHVNVRFLAATHRDLPAMVNAGNFREDLFFRLSVVPVYVPPLRKRLEDIGLLAERLMPDRSQSRLSPELLRVLTSRVWLGNVRELRNFLERAAALGAREALAMADPKPRELPAPTPPVPVPVPSIVPPSGQALPTVAATESFKTIRDRWMDHLEREYMRSMIGIHGRDTGAIAQASGLDRSYIYRLIKKHEL